MKDYYIHGGHLYHWKRSGFLQILYFPFEINIFLPPSPPPYQNKSPVPLYWVTYQYTGCGSKSTTPSLFFLSVSLSLTRLLQILGLKSLQISTERERNERDASEGRWALERWTCRGMEKLFGGGGGGDITYAFMKGGKAICAKLLV